MNTCITIMKRYIGLTYLKWLFSQYNFIFVKMFRQFYCKTSTKHHRTTNSIRTNFISSIHYNLHRFIEIITSDSLDIQQITSITPNNQVSFSELYRLKSNKVYFFDLRKLGQFLLFGSSHLGSSLADTIIRYILLLHIQMYICAYELVLYDRGS